jgi:ATP-binding cassette subfamily B protein
MKHLKKVAGEYKSLIAIYLILGLAGTFLQSFSASYFQKVVDNFTNDLLTAGNIAIYGAALIALYIVYYFMNYPERKLDHGIKLSLKTNALRKVARIDYLSYVRLGTGTLIQRIENGAYAGGNILFEFYLRLVCELLPAMLFSVIFVFNISRPVTIAILLGYVVVFIISNLLLKVLYKIKERILVNEEKLNHFLVRGFMEMVVFRVNRRFGHEIKKAETSADEIVSSKVKMKLIHEAFFTIFAVLIGCVKIGIIVYGWTTKTLTIGQIVALIALVDYAYQPIAIFNVNYVDYKLDKVAFARYTEFLDAQEDARLGHGENISGLSGDISFVKIGFRYNGREIFNDFDLNIEQGKTTAFVGESGSGKSTAVKLLAGLLHPHSGHIEMDGRDLAQINLNSYYEHIMYLPQEPPVFDGTLRENLVFDNLTDDAELIDAIGKVGLSDLYTKLEKGLDTQLGERGVTLSGGERQQLALARLWFTNAKVIIFDEATSAIDNLTEEAVMKNVMALLAGKTVIAIAHRLDSIKSFDKIVVFQDGRIMEQDRFDDLIERRQSFYELYNRTTI